MPTGNRAVSAIRITTSAAAVNPGAGRSAATRSPAQRPKRLSNKSRGGGGGSFAVKLIFLLLIGVTGYFGWQQFVAFKRRPKAPPPPVKKQVVDFVPEPEPVQPVITKPATNRVVKQKRRPKTLEEMIAEEVAREQVAETGVLRKRGTVKIDPEEARKAREAREQRMRQRYEAAKAARQEVEQKIAAARQEAGVQALTGFGGVKFGDVQTAVPSVWGPILPGDTVEKSGLTYAVYGEPTAKATGTLGASPLVWVTPTTKRAFRIEFFRALALKPKQLHDAETALLVEKMKGALKREPLALREAKKDVRGCEYVFPVGTTTVRIGEFGDQLSLIVEDETLRQEAKKEFDAQRTAEAKDTKNDDVLVSTRYPMGPAVSYKGLISRFREGTPSSFCGITFGRKPHESETIVDPKNGEKGYYLDYTRAKCTPFRGFDIGKADIDPYRGGVFAVTLWNNAGGANGIYEADFFKNVKEALNRQYLVEPVERKGTREFPELVYSKGDVEIVFGPDPSGGFRLKATQGTLADIAHIAPVSRPTRKRHK